MTRATLVVTDHVTNALRALAHERTEIGAVLNLGVSRHGQNLRLLVRDVLPVADEHSQRHVDELAVDSSGWARHLAQVATSEGSAGWLHTHPNGDPRPSRRDARVDTELHGPFTVRTDTDLYLSVVLAPTAEEPGFSFTGMVWDGDDELVIERMVIVGPRLRVVWDFEHKRADQSVPKTFDRQVRAFGGDLQAALSTVRIGIVGAGGTGSAVAEQLARLGVGELLCIDYDTLSLSNTTRIYGSSPDQVGDAKVKVLAGHLQRIAPSTSVETIEGSITSRPVADTLAGCDVVFGCTDDEAGRLVLSRLASYQLIPVIDCGVLIDSAAGTIRGIFARVTVLYPGAACLVCRGRVDPKRAAAEITPFEERGRLIREGYAPELGQVEPAVVSYTTLAASLAVGELIERFVGFGADPSPSEVLARVHDRAISTNRREPAAGHYCDPSAGLVGVGDTRPFLGQSWVT